MSDRYIEKTFLYMLFLSLILHLGVFAGLYYFPISPPKPPNEPVFIDLQQAQEPKQPLENHQYKTKHRSDQRIRVPKESTPRANSKQDVVSVEKQPAKSTEMQSPAAKPSPHLPEAVSQHPQITPGSSVASLLKPKGQTAQHAPSIQQLFPGTGHLAKLEESYRHKFEKDIAEGDTRFMNSDDILFGSFLHRLENAVYGVWRYPQEAAVMGIEGVTPVRITFNRNGEITNIQQLESSGARILDEEVQRTLRAIGRVGGFPKGYEKDEFHLIAFFQYGGARRSLR
jgi:protein TonB